MFVLLNFKNVLIFQCDEKNQPRFTRKCFCVKSRDKCRVKLTKLGPMELVGFREEYALKE